MPPPLARAQNIGETLHAAGFRWCDVARLRVNVTSSSALLAYKAAREAALGVGGILLPPPPMTARERRAAAHDAASVAAVAMDRVPALELAETVTIVSTIVTPRGERACIQIEADAAR